MNTTATSRISVTLMTLCATSVLILNAHALLGHPRHTSSGAPMPKDLPNISGVMSGNAKVARSY